MTTATSAVKTVAENFGDVVTVKMGNFGDMDGVDVARVKIVDIRESYGSVIYTAVYPEGVCILNKAPIRKGKVLEVDGIETPFVCTSALPCPEFERSAMSAMGVSWDSVKSQVGETEYLLKGVK